MQLISAKVSKTLGGFAAVALMAAAPFAQAGSYTGLFVFGDSLSDPGNGFAISGGVFPPTPSKRFTDGPTAAEQLATSIGLTASGNYVTPAGTNYAVGGGRSGNGNFNFLANFPTGIQSIPGLGPTGVADQVVRFASQARTFTGATTLFMVNGGANDFFFASGLPGANAASLIATAQQAAQNIASTVNTLYGLGATHFLIPNLADIGKTPLFAGNPAGAGAATLYSLTYDAALAAALNNLQATRTGIDIVQFNSYAFVESVLANPAAYGVTNTTGKCAALTTGCAGYLFWDDVHPTQFASSITAAAYRSAVPLPASLLLLVAGFGLMGLMPKMPKMRKRRQTRRTS
jgi:phospholipase/lecithinase/hemolysin